jgi:hypothetical protein
MTVKKLSAAGQAGGGGAMPGGADATDDLESATLGVI